MLYISLVDALFLIVGIFIGACIMACMSVSGQKHRCEDCIVWELLEDDHETE